MDLAKALRKGVRATLRPFLIEQGFTEFTDFAAWRKGDRWIDCVELVRLVATRFGFPNRLGRRMGEEIVANAATFSLEVGVYYTDLHLLPWTGPVPDRPRCLRGEGSRLPTCERQISLARSYEFGNVQATLFPVANDGLDLDAALEDAFRALRSRGIPWLGSTHDIEAYLARRDQAPPYDTEATESIEFSEEEREEIAAWMKENGVGEGTAFTWYPSSGGEPPEPLRRRLEDIRLRDHTALDRRAPWGDLLYGLLLGSGRQNEAVEALRRDSDPGFAERRFEEILAAPIEDRAYLKRWASRERRFWEARLRTEREHLALLEAALASET